MFPYGFWNSYLWKEAARAGLRQISKLVGQGNLARASSLATTPGVLKPSAAGSQLRQLGAGSEGAATLVAHPQHGVAVRKLYDPNGISSPAMIARKEELGKALGSDPNFARFYGSAPTPRGGTMMHFNEYVPSTQQSPSPSSASITRDRAQESLNRLGYQGHDLRAGNMITDSNTGQTKVIDYLPGKPNEFKSTPGSNEIGVLPRGYHLMNDTTGTTEPSRLLRSTLTNKNVPLARGTAIGATKKVTNTTPTVPSSSSNITTPSVPQVNSQATSVGKRRSSIPSI